MQCIIGRLNFRRSPEINIHLHLRHTSYVDVVTLDFCATVVVLVKERKREIGKLEEPGIDKRQKNSKVWPSHVFIPSTTTNPATVATKGYRNPIGTALGITANYLWLVLHMRVQRGGQGVRTPPEKSQKYRVSKQYWSGSPVKLQSYQATKPAFKVGQSLARQRNAI